MNRLVYPKANQQLTFAVEAIFGTPEEWKATDDANPALFTYTVRCFRFDFEKGRILPRELTPKEQREQEDKNKKAGKKDTKKEDGNDEEVRKQDEQDERRREEEWNQLPPEDHKYREFEDPFQAPQLKFENKEKTETLSGKEFVVFKERVFRDQGEWIYVIKAPAANEEELAKMRKAKPKTLANPNDLNPVVMRSWLDYSALNSDSTTSLVQRCTLLQVDKTADSPQPKLETCYIKVKVSLSEPLVMVQDGLLGEELIADPAVREDEGEKVRVVKELEEEMRLGIESLAMEFSGMFMRELNLYEDFKNMNYFLTKKNDITKRKEHFLYDFNVSGKYKILKDRLKKVIVYLCEKYFQEQMQAAKSFTGVSCSAKDQFYSEIYNFLVAKYKQTLHHLISEKKENLREVEVLSQPAQLRNIEKYLEAEIKETRDERVKRVIEEYQVLEDLKYGEQLLKREIERDPSDADLKYSSAIYCVKNKLKQPEEVLSFVEDYLSYHKDDLQVQLQYLLLLIATQSEDNCKKAWIFLRELITSEPTETKNLVLASFLFSDLLKMHSLGETYLCMAERTHLKQLGKVPEDGRHQQTPVQSELPSVKALPSYSQSLEEEDMDELWVQVLKMFLDLNLLNIVSVLQSKVKATSNPIFDVLKLKKLLAQYNFQEFSTKSKELYQQGKSQYILDLMVSHFLEHPAPETEGYLKTNLLKNSGPQQLSALLKLAFFYLNKEQYANSRSCILKYLEKKPLNSGFSWRILGICELSLENLSEALDSFKKANVADISNSENWLWLARVYSLRGSFVMCNQCLNQYESMVGRKCGGDAAKAILTQLGKETSPILCQEKMRSLLLERLSVQEAS